MLKFIGFCTVIYFLVQTGLAKVILLFGAHVFYSLATMLNQAGTK